VGVSGVCAGCLLGSPGVARGFGRFRLLESPKLWCGDVLKRDERLPRRVSWLLVFLGSFCAVRGWRWTADLNVLVLSSFLWQWHLIHYIFQPVYLLQTEQIPIATLQYGSKPHFICTPVFSATLTSLVLQIWCYSSKSSPLLVILPTIISLCGFLAIAI